MNVKQKEDARKPTTDNMATAPIPAPTCGHLQALILASQSKHKNFIFSSKFIPLSLINQGINHSWDTLLNLWIKSWQLHSFATFLVHSVWNVTHTYFPIQYFVKMNLHYCWNNSDFIPTEERPNKSMTYMEFIFKITFMVEINPLDGSFSTFRLNPTLPYKVCKHRDGSDFITFDKRSDSMSEKTGLYYDTFKFNWKAVKYCNMSRDCGSSCLAGTSDVVYLQTGVSLSKITG